MAKRTVRMSAASEPFDLERFVPFVLNSLSRRLNMRLEKAFRVKRLTIHDWRLLATLANTQLNRPADIANYIATDPSTLSRMIDRFARAGVITRNKPAGEARITELELTKLGRALYDAAFGVIIQERDFFLVSLTVNEREQFTRLLVKLCENYEPFLGLPEQRAAKSVA